MSLTPHQLIENIDLVCSVVPRDQYERGLANAARQMSAQAVHFDFGDVKPLDAHYDFADELWKQNLFRLPADCVLFTWNAERNNAVLASMGPDRSNRKDDLVFFIMGRAESTDGRPIAVIPWGTTVVGPEKGEWMALASKLAEDATPEHSSKNAFALLSAFTVMLMGKDVEQQVFPRPDKLNKARAAKGKPAINERRVIRIKAEHRRAYDHAAAEHAAGRSPVMHFRRGHFRTLHRGETEERIVPVAPCIVNANEDAKPIAKRYEVVK